MRRNDALEASRELPETTEAPPESSPAVGLDLDQALATLSEPMRLCLVLSYHEGMSHGEIVEATGMPLGTVKSNIQRGAKKLRTVLAAYRETESNETES